MASVKAMTDNPSQWSESIHPEDRAGALDALERARQGEAGIREYRIRRPDGDVRWAGIGRGVAGPPGRPA